MTASTDADRLLDWFEAHRRDLPWRGEARDPYRVIISEFMLQQTQVDRVVPRFESFIARFPNFATLAAATEQDVLAAWSGLGYYQRARQVHALARSVVEQDVGLPTTAEELQTLPGVGPYTAAAVASLAFDRPSPVLDGNVLRVASRFLLIESDPRRTEARKIATAWIAKLMVDRSPRLVNESLMELGALVCSPRRPQCETCPLAPSCRARETRATDRIPPPRKSRDTVALTWVAACCIDNSGRWLLRRFEGRPFLNGLWLPPLGDLSADADPIETATGLLPFPPRPGVQQPPVSHTITHRRITVHPIVFRDLDPSPICGGWRWAKPGSPELATSSLLEKLVNPDR